MAQIEAQSMVGSDPEGSIFLRQITIEEIIPTPSWEELVQSFLDLSQWQQAESVLDQLDRDYPEFTRITYDRLSLGLLVERGGVEKNTDSSLDLILMEVKSYLYKMIMRRRALGVLAVRAAV